MSHANDANKNVNVVISIIGMKLVCWYRVKRSNAKKK